MCFGLFFWRKAEVFELRAPGGLSVIDENAGIPGRGGPCVSVRRMQPAAADIQVEPAEVASERPATQMGTGFEEQDRPSGGSKPTSRSHACRTTTYDDDVVVAAQDSW
jgi:hypothetical protein